MSTRRVWVNLWDDSGAGYKGARTHGVKLPEDALVDDLIDAVHAKNSDVLQGIIPAQLTVFKNAAHFHARQTEGPLRASTPLKPEELEEEALGASEDEALIVLVPSPSGMNPCIFGKVRHILSILCM